MQSYYRDATYPYRLETSLLLAGKEDTWPDQRETTPIAEPNVQCTQGKYRPPTISLLKQQAQKRVLIYDDDESICQLLHRLFRQANYQPGYRLTLRNWQEEIETIKAQADIAIFDRHLDVHDGLRFSVELRKQAPTLPIILISALPLTIEEQQLLELADVHFFQKPFSTKELLLFVRQHIS